MPGKYEYKRGVEAADACNGAMGGGPRDVGGGGHRTCWRSGGAAAGSVLTLIAGVVTAYIPSFRDEYRRRAAEREQAHAALRRVSELPVTGGPAGLLDPRRGIVGFVGREDDLVDLVAWCEHDRPRGVRLVTGSGGVGKTRLSVELCARLAVMGWRCEWPGDGGEAGAVEAVRRVHRGRMLLVVDYAESRTGQASSCGR